MPMLALSSMHSCVRSGTELLARLQTLSFVQNLIEYNLFKLAVVMIFKQAHED